MARFIDADAFIDNAIKLYCKDCDRRKGHKNGKLCFIYEIGEAPCRACSVDDMKDDIENAPTADVVEVVRRKECKYNPKNPRLWSDNDTIQTYIMCCAFPEDGFCSYGKKPQEVE